MQAPYSVATVADWKKAQEKAVRTARWAVTMAKVRIRSLDLQSTPHKDGKTKRRCSIWDVGLFKGGILLHRSLSEFQGLRSWRMHSRRHKIHADLYLSEVRCRLQRIQASAS